MFKKLFIDSFKNAQWLQITFGFTILIFAVFLTCYFTTNFTNTMAIWILAISIVVVLGNWISNVMVPRGRLKKGIPSKYKDLSKQYNSKLSLESFAEIYLHAKGLAFTSLSLIPIVVIVIFVIL